MSRYNKTIKTPSNVDVTHENGSGFSLNAFQELLAILSDGIKSNFYENMKTREDRLTKAIENAVKAYGAEFVAKTIVYVRSKIGQRTSTHLAAVALAPHLSGAEFARHFYAKFDRERSRGGVVYRIDDMLEITAAYQGINQGKRLPNAMSKGFKTVLEKADRYELAKYQAKNKSVSLVDMFNLVHPVPRNEEMQAAFRDLIKGELKQFNTLEDTRSKAGQEVAAKVSLGEITKSQAEVQLNEMKNESFKELLESKKIGYKALIMNLRNFMKLNPTTDVINLAVAQITNEVAIRKSLIQPMELDIAIEVLLSEGRTTPSIIEALNKAIVLSIPNLKEVFTGTTALVYDTSASMTSEGSCRMEVRTRKSSMDKAALMCALFAKGTGADVYHFASGCEKVPYNPGDTVNTLASKFSGMCGRLGHGTEFDSIVQTLQKSGKAYTRVIVFSDMQGADKFQHSSIPGNPYVYSFNLNGYGTTMANPRNPRVFSLFGYSAEMVRVATQMEVDPKVLMKEIQSHSWV